MIKTIFLTLVSLNFTMSKYCIYNREKLTDALATKFDDNTFKQCVEYAIKDGYPNDNYIHEIFYSSKTNFLACEDKRPDIDNPDNVKLGIKAVNRYRRGYLLDENNEPLEFRRMELLWNAIGHNTIEYYGCVNYDDENRYAIYSELADFSAFDYGNMIKMTQEIFKKDTLILEDWVRFCLWLFESMATILDLMHTKKLIHRDIKPENFVITKSPKPSVKIIDFEFITEFNKAEERSGNQSIPLPEYAGTVFYNDPSTENHPGKWGPKTDIYSLGWTFRDILLGKFIRPKDVYKGLDDLLQQIKNTALPKEAEIVKNLEIDKHKNDKFANFMKSFNNLTKIMLKSSFDQRCSAETVINELKKMRSKFLEGVKPMEMEKNISEVVIDNIITTKNEFKTFFDEVLEVEHLLMKSENEGMVFGHPERSFSYGNSDRDGDLFSVKSRNSILRDSLSNDVNPFGRIPITRFNFDRQSSRDPLKYDDAVTTFEDYYLYGRLTNDSNGDNRDEINPVFKSNLSLKPIDELVVVNHETKIDLLI